MRLGLEFRVRVGVIGVRLQLAFRLRLGLGSGTETGIVRRKGANVLHSTDEFSISGRPRNTDKHLFTGVYIG